jgi:hypothetical protein
MGVELRYAPVPQRRADPAVQVRGEGNTIAFGGREEPFLNNIRGKGGIGEDFLQFHPGVAHNFIVTPKKIERKVSTDHI